MSSTTATTEVVLSWSGGKDATLTLRALRADETVTVTGLLTTVSTATGRTAMHGVRPELIDAQADAAGLPVEFVELPADPSNEQYEARMRDALDAQAARGVDEVAFGDLFLEDVRAYRESNLADAPLDGRWPLWRRDTDDLAREFVEAGFRATLVCVDGDALDESFAGRAYDTALLDDLPDEVDPCAENGEFHTFVTDGPTFTHPVELAFGETVTKEIEGTPFYYQDLSAK